MSGEFKIHPRIGHGDWNLEFGLVWCEDGLPTSSKNFLLWNRAFGSLIPKGYVATFDGVYSRFSLVLSAMGISDKLLL